MGTDLYAVKVRRVDDDEVDFSVQSIYPDAPLVPRSKTYALRLVLDPVLKYEFKDKKHVAGCPLYQEIAGDETTQERQAMVREFVKSVKQRELREATARKHPVWELKVKVTDPAWIQHLRKGMSWDSRATDDGNGKPAKARRFEPAGPSGRSANPMAGMKKKTVNKDFLRRLTSRGTKNRECKIKNYVVPTLGVRSYVADPVLTGRQAGPKALEELLGQPVIFKFASCEPRVRALVWLSAGAKTMAYADATGFKGMGSRQGLEWMGRAWLKEDGSGAKARTSKRTKKTNPKKAARKRKQTKAPTKSAGRKVSTKPLAGKVVVVTGTFKEHSRKEVRARLAKAGAKVTGSVSGKTDLLVCGSDPGGKLDDAKERGIKVVKERALAKLLG